MSGPDQERQALSGCRNRGRPLLFHANPNKASELGRIGGRSNRHLAGENPEAPPLALESATDVRETVARLIADLHAGKLHPGIAAGPGPLLHLQLRAIEKTEVERRIAEIEEQLRKLTSAMETHNRRTNGAGERQTDHNRGYDHLLQAGGEPGNGNLEPGSRRLYSEFQLHRQ